MKIAFIGAGSVAFTKGLTRDILAQPALSNCELCLMDIHEGRLETIKEIVARVIKLGKYDATVTSTIDRAKALENADAVIISVLMGGVDVFRYDLEIPKKYGVDINVGDTRGVAGIFRAMRTVPLMLEICRDIEKYCPDAVVLNYTNPMPLICSYLNKKTNLNIMGLCHSIQHGVEEVAGYINVPKDEITYSCAGLNHQAYFLKLERNGEDLYPLLREAMNKKEIYMGDSVRFEMFKMMDYWVTESSGHNSEYNSWFRKRQDLIEKYCHNREEYWNPGLYAYSIIEYTDKRDHYDSWLAEWKNGDIDLTPGNEYASYILNALLGDGKPYRFNGNVLNHGLIDNIPYEACVEVPIMVSKHGYEPVRVGALPKQCELLVSHLAMCDELAVEGMMEGDLKKIYQAVCYDPLTSAVLSLEEIKNMVNEMFEQNREWLGYFKSIEI